MLKLPTLFWMNPSDAFMKFLGSFGLFFSILGIFGVANSITFFLMWVIYLSIVNVGQIFYSYGWETLLLEGGFLGIFICPFWGRLGAKASAPPVIVIWMYRWLVFRMMIGAGLIKIRSADSCWRDLTCLNYHYETQPNPNPFSWYFHQLPIFFQKLSVVFNHFCELIVPLFYFGPRKLRLIAGVLTLFFQGMIIMSGNLSYLNWITIVVAIPLFDDKFFSFLFKRSSNLEQNSLGEVIFGAKNLKYATSFLLLLVIGLSVKPTLNLLSSRQLMNSSFDNFHLVNTYGAFGTVGQKRPEIIIEGTSDYRITEKTQWKEYIFKSKPGPLDRISRWISPYHYRLDWQMWFAAMGSFERNPWLVHFAYKLLKAPEQVEDLLAENPFQEKPPVYIRGRLYQYQYTKWGEPNWWKREFVREYFSPLSLGSVGLLNYLRKSGFQVQ